MLAAQSFGKKRRCCSGVPRRAILVDAQLRVDAIGEPDGRRGPAELFDGDGLIREVTETGSAERLPSTAMPNKPSSPSFGPAGAGIEYGNVDLRRERRDVSVANRRVCSRSSVSSSVEPEIEVEIDHRSPRSPELRVGDDCGEKPRRLATRDGAVIDRQ